MLLEYRTALSDIRGKIRQIELSVKVPGQTNLVNNCENKGCERVLAGTNFASLFDHTSQFRLDNRHFVRQGASTLLMPVSHKQAERPRLDR